MKYKVDKAIRPAYLQIYNQIKADIISGVLTATELQPARAEVLVSVCTKP